MASVDDIIEDVKVTIDEVQKNDAEFDTEVDNEDMDTIIKSKIVDALHFVYANADWSVLEPDVVSTTSDTSYSVVDGVGYYTLPENFLRLVYAKFASWKRYLGHEDMIMWNDPEYPKLLDEYTTGTPDRPRIAITWRGKNKCLELYSAKGKNEPVDFFAGYDYYLIGQGVFESSGEHEVETLVKQGDGWYVYTSEIPLKPVAKVCAIYDNGGVYTLSFFDPETFTREEMVADTDSFVLGYMEEPSLPVATSETIDIPEKCYRAVIYYIAGLVLTTYRESGAAQMMFTEASDLIGFTQQAARQQLQAEQQEQTQQ